MIEVSYLGDKKTGYNTIQAYIIAILTLVPTISIFVYLKFAIVLLLVVGNMFANRIYLSKKIIKYYLLWGANIILSAVSVLIVESDIEMTVILHEIQRLAFYLLLYLLCSSLKVKFATIVNICRFLLLIHLGIQLIQYFRIGNTYTFLRTYYLPEGESTAHLDMAYWIETDYFRSGSLFLNPNVYILYPIVFELVFLQNMENKTNMFDYFWLIACVASIYLTGSRTSLILFVTVYVYNSVSNKKMSLNKIILPVVLVIGFAVLSSGFGVNMESRIFKLADGVQGSTNIKFDGLEWYFNKSNPICWFAGSLGSRKMAIPIDMEFGYILAWFGVMGLYWYINIIKNLVNVNKAKYKTLSRGIQIVIILTAFSSSTVLNMSVFPFICLVAYCEITSAKKGIEYA